MSTPFHISTNDQGDKVRSQGTQAKTPHTATGIFALLGGLLRVRGTGAQKVRRLAPSPHSRRSSTALALSVTVLVLSAGVARAEPPKLVSYGTFADEGSLGVAVDQSSGDVYVGAFYNVENGFSAGNSEEVDASGRSLVQSPFGSKESFGLAVNPVNHDVDVAMDSSHTVDVYGPNGGGLVSSFEVESEFSGFNLAQIATNSNGDVYVPEPERNKVAEYSPTGHLEAEFSGSGPGALSGPLGVAVDSSGNVWVADTGNNRIEEFSPTTREAVAEIKSEGVQAVALDEHSEQGNVLAIVDNSADFCGSIKKPCDHLVEYSPAGAQLADLGAGDFGSTLLPLPLSMVAVSESSGRVYVTDGGKNLVWIFGPSTKPAVERELTVEVGTSEAKLGALVNPGGIETGYRFEYDTREYREGEGPHGVSVPFPEGSVGQGVTARTVWAAAKGLAPGTTYHYRIVATNELAREGVYGPDETFTTQTTTEASCPNEQFRAGFSANLPDCRAYELVTTPTETSTQPSDPTVEMNPRGPINAARDGNRMSYSSTQVLPGSVSGGAGPYVATRNTSGWSSEGVLPLQSYTSRCTRQDSAMEAYSTDLSRGVLFVGGDESEEEPHLTSGCGAEEVEVVSGEPLGVENLLLRDNTDGGYRLANVTPPGVAPANAYFQGASSDLSHVVFSENAKLTENAPDGAVLTKNAPGGAEAEDLYEWDEGVLRLVTVLPDGTPVAGSLARRGLVAARAVSTGGSDVFFTAGGDLYLRENAEQPPAEECSGPFKACTVQVDRSAQGGKGPGGGGSFQDASADGSQVFFTADASAGLTGDTVEGSGTNLYHYDLNTGQLTDLTPASNAEVKTVIGISEEDGSYVYFVADGKLTAGATAGQPNIYLYHDGEASFIAPASFTTPENGASMTAQVSPNGAFLAFSSPASLHTIDDPNGYDNVDQVTGKPDPEIYLYSAASNQLTCVSCDPFGEAPTGGATMEVEGYGAPHYVLDSGRVFFDTAEALAPSDTNGQTDVYEYENGQLHLISSGTSSSHSLFLDASENGENVFFLTRQTLVPRDTDEEALNIYDARVKGGFPEPSPPQPCTTADACRSAASPQPSIFGAPSSQTFSGVGNLTPAVAAKPKAKPKSKPKCKKGFVKKKGKCVKSKTKCKKGFVKKKGKCVKSKKKKGKKSTAKKASNDRRVKS